MSKGKRSACHSTREFRSSYCWDQHTYYSCGFTPPHIRISSPKHHSSVHTTVLLAYDMTTWARGYISASLVHSPPAHHKIKQREHYMNANKRCYGLFILFSEVSQIQMVGLDPKHCLEVQHAGHSKLVYSFFFLSLAPPMKKKIFRKCKMKKCFLCHF